MITGLVSSRIYLTIIQHPIPRVITMMFRPFRLGSITLQPKRLSQVSSLALSLIVPEAQVHAMANKFEEMLVFDELINKNTS